MKDICVQCGDIWENGECLNSKCETNETVQTGLVIKTDDLTNGIMDLIREKTGLDSDSDADDEIYTAIHKTLMEVQNA